MSTIRQSPASTPGARSLDRKVIAVAAGGTGGHIYPALAVADELSARGHRVVFFGCDDRMETRIIPAHGYPLHTSRIHGAVGLRAVLGLPGRLVTAGARAARTLKDVGADLVLGMGGYPSAPALLGGALLRLPLLVHESNAVFGLSNRFARVLGAHLALRKAPDPGERPLRRARVTGLPLMPGITTLDRAALRSEARRHFGLPESAVVIAVIGGSLGSRAINQAAAELGTRWNGRPDRHLLIKTGGQPVMSAVSGTVSEVAYLDRMDLAYAAADVFVTRAGAATLAELEHLGLPAVVVPLPHSAGGHQLANATEFARHRPAVVLEERHLTATSLEEGIDTLLAGTARPGERRSHHAAARDLADWALELIDTAPHPRSTSTSTSHR